MGLIEIKKNDNKDVVSARKLHEFLEVKSSFKDWIKRRIIKYNFVENIDFITVAQKKATAQKNSYDEKDYLLNLDTAKEICMIENNLKGREARMYFIQCEKKYIEALEKKSEKCFLEGFKDLDYDEHMLIFESILHNLKIKLVKEKYEIEEKIRKIDATGLARPMRTELSGNKIIISQDL